jgi:hypothetical protein
MKRSLLVVALVVALGMSASAARVKTFETITVADTAIGISTLIHSPTALPQMKVCLLRVEAAEVRIRWDGTAPTASVGMPVEVLETIKVETFTDISQLKMIRTTGTSASVTVVCWSD